MIFMIILIFRMIMTLIMKIYDRDHDLERAEQLDWCESSSGVLNPGPEPWSQSVLLVPSGHRFRPPGCRTSRLTESFVTGPLAF